MKEKFLLGWHFLPESCVSLPWRKQDIGMNRIILLVCMLVGCIAECRAQSMNYICCESDSAKVCELLSQDAEDNPVLFYARRLTGIPYVGHTLEGNEPERLVINLHQLDCTTLVETVLALARTHAGGRTALQDYAMNLADLRYRGGQMNGYTSRLHYFDWWINDNIRRGNVAEVSDTKQCTATFRVDNHYMTRHPDAYEHLKGRPERIDSIRMLEEAGNGGTFHYLPKHKTLLSKSHLGFIHDGDVIAIVTGKDGLDYAHLGFAVWGKDGKLHLLNASSIHKKVVEEPKTIHQYLKEHPSFLGIRVLRLSSPSIP